MLDYYASIELQGQTLYVTNAQESLVRTVGGVPVTFRPVLIVGRLRSQFQSLDIARETPATASMTLVNEDEANAGVGFLDQFLGLGNARKIWNNRRVVLKYGGADGDAWETMSTENAYRVRPATIRHTRADVSFSCVDIRADQDKPILVDRFPPSAEDNARGRYVQVVFGDYTVAEGPSVGGRVRAYADNVATNQFTVAAHAIGAGGGANIRVWHHDADGGVGGVPIVRELATPADFTEDLANGRFTLTPAYVATYPPDFAVDRFTVDCSGVEAVPPIGGGGSGTLQKAPDIMAYLLEQFGGASASEIDAAGTWATALGESDQHNNRRVYVEQTKVMDAIGEYLRENSLELFTDGGQYRLRFFEPTDEVRAVVDEDQLETGSGAAAAYDPQGLYTNRMVAQYGRNITDPEGADYRGTVEENDTEAQAEYGSVETSESRYECLYIPANISLALQRQLFVRASAGHHLTCTVSYDDLTPNSPIWRLALSDGVVVNGWQYNRTFATIRALDRNAERARVTMTVLIVADSFPIGQWSSDTEDALVPIQWSSDTQDSDAPGKWA